MEAAAAAAKRRSLAQASSSSSSATAASLHVEADGDATRRSPPISNWGDTGKMAREGVRGVFEYLLKRRKVKLDAGQQKGFDSQIVADELLKRWSMTIVESKED
ncbi:unnamed protein product [Camellia sinensis]